MSYWNTSSIKFAETDTKMHGAIFSKKVHYIYKRTTNIYKRTTNNKYPQEKTESVAFYRIDQSMPDTHTFCASIRHYPIMRNDIMRL